MAYYTIVGAVSGLSVYFGWHLGGYLINKKRSK